MTKVVQRTVQPQAELHLQAAGVSPLMSRLLAARGITEAVQLSANLSNLIPP